MKKKTHFLLLLISISFFGCNNAAKKSTTTLSNIDKDFPVTEKLELKPFNNYDIFGDGFCEVDDQVLWYLDNRADDFGSCYDLNTGKKLSAIASRGTAANELSDFAGFKIIGDSVLLYASRSTIKTFAKKDIVNNIPMKDRRVSVTTAPNDVFVHRMTKLPNGSALATIRPPFEFEKKKMNETNKKSVVLFNNNDVNSYETIKYDNFNLGKAKTNELDANDLIKWTYAQGSIEIKDNDMAVFFAQNQFILYTFDLNRGTVVNEKRYSNILRDGGEGSFTTINDMGLNVDFTNVSDKYILCLVSGYFNKEDKDYELQRKAIFVFDWDLNPIKKFELPDQEGKTGYYKISNDCSSVYFCEDTKGGITLHKAELNI